MAVRLQLLELLGGFLRTQAMATVARLGVADIVGSEPVPVEDLAARVEADPSALQRVMRLLASDGIFSEARPGAFIGKPLSEGLREDHPSRSVLGDAASRPRLPGLVLRKLPPAAK